MLALTWGLAADIAKADFTFGEPSRLSHPVSSSSYEYGCSISPDGLELYFSSGEPHGGYDLYVVSRTTPDDVWGNRTSLGPFINTSRFNLSASLSSDGLSLFFSQGPSVGNQAIWVTTRQTLDGPWGSPTELGPAINKGVKNTEPAVSAVSPPAALSARTACSREAFAWDITSFTSSSV